MTDHPHDPGERTSWWPLAAVCVAVFMLLVDITVVNVALPDIKDELHASFDGLQWVIDAYALTLAAFLLNSGSLGDRIGRRKVFVVGIGIFTAASLACGLAPNIGVLTASRAVQGVGGAIMFANSLALLAASYHGPQRGTAFGVWGATTGASVAIGPLVGGALTSGLSWRWIFFVNLPVGAGAIWLSLAKLTELRDRQEHDIDWTGLVLFSGGLAALIVALIRGNDHGWASGQILALFAAAAVLLAVFVLVERRRPEPMLDVALFRRPAFTGAQIAAFAISAAVFSLFLYLSLYLQDVLGYSALETGIRFLPISVTSLLIAPAAGRATERLPFRWLVGAGLGVATAGLLLQYGVDARSGWTALLAGFVVMGLGIGLVNPPLGSLAVGVVDRSRSGMASGINTTFRQVGIATGTAAFGALFQGQVRASLAHDLPQRLLPPGALDRLAGAVSAGAVDQVLPQIPPQARDAVRQAARDAFTSGLNRLFVAGAVVAFLGALLSALLIRQRDLVSSGQSVSSG